MLSAWLSLAWPTLARSSSLVCTCLALEMAILSIPKVGLAMARFSLSISLSLSLSFFIAIYYYMIILSSRGGKDSYLHLGRDVDGHLFLSISRWAQPDLSNILLFSIQLSKHNILW